MTVMTDGPSRKDEVKQTPHFCQSVLNGCTRYQNTMNRSKHAQTVIAIT